LNLIITCARSLESETKNEIKKILDELGDQEPEILNVGMRGILMVDTIIEPSKIIDWVRNKIVEEPWLIRYCLRIIPIQSITETNIDKIKQKIIKLKFFLLGVFKINLQLLLPPLFFLFLPSFVLQSLTWQTYLAPSLQA